MNKKGIGFLAIFLIIVLVVGAGFGVYKIATKDKVPETIVPEENLIELNEDVNEVIQEPEPEPEPVICTTIWNCGEWSKCKNGERTRTCVDLNKCEPSTWKEPILVEKCKSKHHSSSAPVVVPDVFGELILTHKDLINNWVSIWDENITVSYTIEGKTFQVTNLTGNIPEGYEFVYAMDKGLDRFVDYAIVMKISNITESLPFVGDWNGNITSDFVSYCNFENGYDNYTHCTGAKIWLVPTDNILSEENSSWSNLSWIDMADYYYETDLITYTRT